MTDFYRPLTKLTPRPRTLVAIDVERAYEEHGDDIHAILDTLLPGDLNAQAITNADGTLQHISVQSRQQPNRRFRVRPGQQLVCDRTTGTAATLHRSEIDTLYFREEVTYEPHT